MHPAAERRFLYLWVEWGSTMRPVWNPDVNPCTKKVVSGGVSVRKGEAPATGHLLGLAMKHCTA